MSAKVSQIQPYGHRRRKNYWEPKKGERFQCHAVEAENIRDLKVLAALNGLTLAEALDIVLKAGLSVVNAQANIKRSED